MIHCNNYIELQTIGLIGKENMSSPTTFWRREHRIYIINERINFLFQYPYSSFTYVKYLQVLIFQYATIYRNSNMHIFRTPKSHWSINCMKGCLFLGRSCGRACDHTYIFIIRILWMMVVA